MKSIMIAAAGSGAGKTTLTLGILAALRARGVAVRAAKAGPDYIDPAFHAAACGAPSYNLDSWAMGTSLLESLVARSTSDAELLVVESAMGLFDGVIGIDGQSSAPAGLAKRLGIPVVLVIDVFAQSQTAAAVAHGLATFQPNIKIAGVVLNRVAGERHAQPICEALAARGLQVLGAIPYDVDVKLPERHLGLIQSRENTNLQQQLKALAEMVERNVDLDALMATADFDGFLETTVAANSGTTHHHEIPVIGRKIALASDNAFSFVYPHLLDEWRNAGAEIIPFSPLADEAPPLDCDACWLPGGYPELYAEQLAAATGFREGLCTFAEYSPVHGECGGYMVLGDTLQDASGVTHKMTGLLSHSTSFARRKLHLGYREATLQSTTILGKTGNKLRGHEFHYASIIDPGTDDPFAEMADAKGTVLGMEGGIRGNVTGSFFHFISCPTLGY